MSESNAISCEHLLDRLGIRLDQANGPAHVGLILFGNIQAKRLAYGAEKIGDSDWAFFHLDAVGTRLADNLSAFDAAPCEDCGPGIGPMVAAVVAIDPRGAAEFAHPHDRRGIKQPVVLQV